MPGRAFTAGCHVIVHPLPYAPAARYAADAQRFDPGNRIDDAGTDNPQLLDYVLSAEMT
jgi:hypothetical protein